MHPFTGLATREDGAVTACCRSQPVGYVGEQTLEEIWNNDAMKRILIVGAGDVAQRAIVFLF